MPFHWLFVVLFVVGTGAFLYLMLFGGFSWSVPDGWLAVVVWSLFVARGSRDGFRNRAARISAGADWLRVGGRRWVDLYDLERVELRGTVLDRSIVFRDAHGRRVSATVGFLRKAPALRDLVVNGVRHSWHRGPTSTRTCAPNSISTTVRRGAGSNHPGGVRVGATAANVAPAPSG